MILFNVFTDLTNYETLSGMVSEPLAVLCFAIALLGLAAGLRVALNRRDEATKRLFRELHDSVVGHKN